MALDLLSVILLSIIQGLLEWWPVSSQGQLSLIIIQGFADPIDILSLTIVFHLGTMFVVLVIFRDRFMNLFQKPYDKWLWRYLIYTTLGTALTGVPMLVLIGDLFASLNAFIISLFIGLLLIVTGCILWFNRRTTILESPRKLDMLTTWEMILFGCIQGFAILPGVSRSGLTITYLLIRQLSKEEALVGSFLVSVPAILGSFVLDVIRGGLLSLISNVSIELILLSIAITFCVGLISINALIRLSQRINFSILCWILGTVVIAYEFIGWLLLNIVI